jgi:hypothetical protein
MDEAGNVPLPLPLAAVLAIVFSGLAHVGTSHRSASRQQGLDGARYALTERDARRDSLPLLPKQAPLRFAPGTAQSDRAVVLTAIADAGPEARRLIEMVQGLVTVSIAPIAAGVAGRTGSTADGYAVELDLGRVSRAYGARGLARVTLHELGHVVDGARVGSDMEKSLDARIPRGWGCDDGGKSGACANRRERFAETFAKWATGDIGADVYLGYRVPPPVPLEGWGQPLDSLVS